MPQENVYNYNPRQRKLFDKVCYCVYKIVENEGLLAKYFIQDRYCETMFSPLFLHSL